MATKKTNQIGHTIYADNIVLTKPAKSSRAVTTLDVNTNLIIIDKDGLMKEVERLSSDKYLSVSEKQGLLREYEAINSRHLNVVVEALEIGMGDSPIYTDYLASHSDLVNMLDLILADMSKGSDITAITNFNTLFSDYYTKIQVLNDKFFTFNTGYIDGIDKRTKLSATILSSKGDSIGDDPTTLSVVIMNDNVNVTTSFLPESYRWERMTNDINGDVVWNQENSLTGYSINVSVDDLVGGVASFLCIFNHQVSELVTYRKTAAITINKLLEGPAGEDAYQTQIISHNGTTFRMSQPFETVLEVRVWQGGEDITSLFGETDFRWRRTSSDSHGDDVWNSAHYSVGGKMLTITKDDVAGKTNFFCDLLTKRS